MAREDALHVLSSEFKLWGVKFDQRQTGGGHIELRWQASPDKQVRSYFIAKTPSDGRGTLNARAEIRRLFRADGLDVKEVVAKPKPALHRALEVPVIEKDSDQIKMLRAEVADLTDVLLDMASALTQMQAYITAQNAPPPAVEQPAPVADFWDSVAVESLPIAEPAPPPKKRTTRSIKTIEYVSEAWNTTDAIARDMGLKKPVAYMKLYYLWKQGVLDMADGGRWRLKPKLMLVKQQRN